MGFLDKWISNLIFSSGVSSWPLFVSWSFQCLILQTTLITNWVIPQTLWLYHSSDVYFAVFDLVFFTFSYSSNYGSPPNDFHINISTCTGWRIFISLCLTQFVYLYKYLFLTHLLLCTLLITHISRKTFPVVWCLDFWIMLVDYYFVNYIFGIFQMFVLSVSLLLQFCYSCIVDLSNCGFYRLWGTGFWYSSYIYLNSVPWTLTNTDSALSLKQHGSIRCLVIIKLYLEHKEPVLSVLNTAAFVNSLTQLRDSRDFLLFSYVLLL